MSSNTTWHVTLNDDPDGISKLSREKPERDVVYKITYKKVYLNSDFDIHAINNGTSTFYDYSTNQNPAIHQWRLEEVRTIKRATIDKLLESIGNSHPTNQLFVSTFLATFRSFITPHNLVDKLLKNYYEHSTNLQQYYTSNTEYLKSLKSLIYTWVSKYKKDFYDVPNFKLLKTFIYFFTHKCPAGKLSQKLESVLVELARSSNSSTDDLVFSGFKWRLPLPIIAFYNLDLLSAREYAEQLTCIDADLFCRVYLPECLGSVWNKRLERKDKVTTVMATVDQFNALTYRVMFSVLSSLNPYNRAKNIDRWIEIAQELRQLKNFASIKAITSALRSAAIFRLEKTWALVDQKHIAIFERLTTAVSDDDNHMALREIMNQEGTAKFATVTKHRKTLSSADFPTELGIVPYLGTFLSDLTMLHAAHKDIIYNEYNEPMVNFEKKLRENSILTQLSLLQASCKFYNLSYHSEFQQLFLKLPSTNSKDSYETSCKLEPKVTAAKATSNTMPRAVSGAIDLSFCNPLVDSAINNCWSFSTLQTKRDKKNKNILRKQSFPSENLLHFAKQDKAAKVYVEGVAGVSAFSKYKSVLVTKRDRTLDVIWKILCKYNINHKASSFYLFQLIPNHPQVLFEDDAWVLKESVPCDDLELLIKKKHFQDIS